VKFGFCRSFLLRGTSRKLAQQRFLWAEATLAYVKKFGECRLTDFGENELGILKSIKNQQIGMGQLSWRGRRP